MNDLILLLVWTGLLGSVVGTVFLWATKHSKRKAGTLAMVGLLVLSLGVEFIRYSAEEQRREKAMIQAATERERQRTAFVEEWQDEIGQYLLNPMTNEQALELSHDYCHFLDTGWTYGDLQEYISHSPTWADLTAQRYLAGKAITNLCPRYSQEALEWEEANGHLFDP